MTAVDASTMPPSDRVLDRLRAAPKLGYAAGALVDGAATQAINIFLLFYATAVCGVPPALAGVALAAGLVVDAIVDPLIGSLSDGWRSRRGRRVPFMMLGAPGTILFLALLFALPRGWSVAGLFAWLTLASIGLRVSISLFLLPYNAAGAEISDDYDERSSIAAWRWGIGMVGAVVTVILGFGVFLAGSGGLSRRAGYLPFALSLGIMVAIGSLIAIRSLSHMTNRLHPATPAGRFSYARLFRELGELFRNASFRTLFIGVLLLFTAAAIHSTLGIHANTYFWGMTPGQVQTVTLALFVGLLCGAPLAGPLLRRLEKRTVLIIGILGLGLAFAVPTTLRLVGALQTASAPVTLLAGVIFVGGALMATAAIAFASMMADAADEHEWLFGARREGLYFAGWAFAGKAAAGFGSLIAGVALQVIGFSAGAASRGQPARGAPPHVVEWIGIIYGPGTGLLTVAAALTCLFYRLDAKAHRAILADLVVRRQHPAD